MIMRHEKGASNCSVAELIPCRNNSMKNIRFYLARAKNPLTFALAKTGCTSAI